MAVAKLTAMLITGITYILIQEMVAILLLGWMYGYGDLGRILQSVAIFRNCVYHLTVGGALTVIVVIRAAVVVFFVCTLFCVGMIIKNEAAAVTVSGIFLGGEYFIERAFGISGSLSGIKCVNPFYCWNMRQVLGEYHNLNLFGYPVGKDTCTLAAALLLVIILPVTGVIAFNKTYQIKMESRLERIMQWLRVRTSRLGQRMSLLYYEFYKMLFQQKKGIVLVILLMWGIYEMEGVFVPVYYATAEEAAYHHYISLMQGPVTEETFSFFEVEKVRLDDMRREIRELMQTGEAEDFLMGQGLQGELQMLEDGFEAAQAQFNALQEKPGDIWEKYIIDERAYEGIWLDTGTDIGLWFVGSVLVLYFISGIYPMDEKKKIMPLLRTTRNGQKKLDRSKNYCVIILTGLVYLAAELPLFLRYKENR